MLISAIRHIIWVSILLLILSILSFVILMRDPLNAELITNNIYSAYYHYLTSLLQGDLGITYNGGESLKRFNFYGITTHIRTLFYRAFISLHLRYSSRCIKCGL